MSACPLELGGRRPTTDEKYCEVHKIVETMANESSSTAMHPSSSSPEQKVTILPDVEKGKSDWREYRSIKLENGVTLTLVHDDQSKTTAAAATVHAGAAADPRSLSGLAHFCEHMCFLGSQKYPGENEYKRYLAQHGGRSNASTSLHLTTYKFEVLSDHAEQALDIFSHFFVAPLFTESGTGREVNAVDSENSKNLVADGRRRLQVLKDIADPTHYFSKFTTGNSETLPTGEQDQLEAVRDALLAFHRKHYRPENLTVVVAGPQSLDELQAWAVVRFCGMKAAAFPDNEDNMTNTEKMIHVAAADAPLYEFSKPAPEFRSAFFPSLQDDKWPVLLTTKPVQSVRRLVLMFPLPSVHKDPDQSPAAVLSHLLGHEGPESSFAALQNAGLLSSLSAGPRVASPDFTLFQISVGLTENGEARWKEVVDIILQHCRLIHEASVDGPELVRMWQEMAALSVMFFDQTSPGGVYGLAPSLSNSIVVHGTAKCISAGSRLHENRDTFPTERVKEFTSMLTPSNCLIERCSQSAWEEMEELESEKAPGVQRKTEQWYGIDYFLSELDGKDVERWAGKEGTTPFLEASSLGLPPSNEFIPRTLELCPDLPEEAKLGPRIEKEVDPPNLLEDIENVGRLWHRLDDRYALPKSVCDVLVRNAMTENVKVGDTWEFSVDSSVHSALLGAIFAEALAQETYDADLAGLHWSVSMGLSGIRIHCSGFSDRLPDLALKVMREFFLSGRFLQESFFVSTKDRLLRSLRTFFESRRADSHAMYYRELLLVSEDVGLDAQLAAANATTLESLKAYHKAMLENSETSIDCLFSGNVSETQAKTFFGSASKMVTDARSTTTATPSQKVWIPGAPERRLIPGDDIELHFASKNPQEENGAVMVSYQSLVPGYRGEGLSPLESLESSASIRLLCHILREPLFNDLRTKQQLGYIVSSYHDMGFSLRPASLVVLGPLAVPIDFIVISVLSKKVGPREVARRVDDFLLDFRSSLENMPESEIQHHATALSTKMLKPVQKLGNEASTHFAKIRRYAPEVLDQNGGTDKDLPWKSVVSLAGTIEALERQDLLATWDRLMQPHSRARVVSCVYGTTFPLQPGKIPVRVGTVVDSIPDIIKLRRRLVPYNNTTVHPPQRFLHWMTNHRTAVGVAAATVALAGATGFTLLSRAKKQK